ncbi:MAG TPA: hypothetical protein PLZ42_05000 [Methanothrix sp.]|nr:hypothetical protein [Methanothrix sp.]
MTRLGSSASILPVIVAEIASGRQQSSPRSMVEKFVALTQSPL